MPYRHYVEILRSLVETPTAPFREHWVGAVLDRHLAAIPFLQFDLDRFGNRIGRLRKGSPTGHVPTFVAHLDHPGFLFMEPPRLVSNGNGAYRYQAIFEGRVMDVFFENAPIRFFSSPGDPGISARVLSVTRERPDTGNRVVSIEASAPLDHAVLGMWDVPVFRVEDEQELVHARVCDDLAGCAAIIEALYRLSELDEIDIAFIFSRAEEAGFCGVLCLLGEDDLHPLLPTDTTYISVETSSEMPGIELGSGAIIRTGDRSSTFDGPITDALWACARRQGINATRRLMDRGTCEATPFARRGLRAGGVCIPLRNYHNMNMKTEKVAPEAISLADAENLVLLISALARNSAGNEAPPVISNEEYDLFLEKGHRYLENSAARGVGA